MIVRLKVTQFYLPDLPYKQDALEPYLSGETLRLHHSQHHQAYVRNLNSLIKGSTLEGKNLEEVILASYKEKTHLGIFNNAAQVWNHTFYWNSMRPGGGASTLTRVMIDCITRDFGSYEAFKITFQLTGITQFGSGWIWLLSENGELKLTSTLNADNPLIQGKRALLTCDVWEHAYYLNYQNRRSSYLDTFLEHLVNWNFAEENLITVKSN